MSREMEVTENSTDFSSSYDVQLSLFDPAGQPVASVQQGKAVHLQVERGNGGLRLSFTSGGQTVAAGRVVPSTKRLASGDFLHILHLEAGTAVVRFADAVDCSQFATILKRNVAKTSVFDERTEEASAKQYFQFYGYLCQQQNMMQDFTRTSTYQAAILQNGSDFAGKVVLDVGAGSGILSFFAAQAGARKVYAIEASSVAQHAKALVEANRMSNVIEVIHGQIEEVHIPEEVDIIISEPMGYMLFNERMLETFLHAKKWLKPTGRMFPSQGDLYCSPFMDDMLSMEQFNKANFWCMTSFHGVDLSSLRGAAAEEYARQPVVDTFDPRILLARPNRYTVDFGTADETDLHRIHYPVNFQVTSPGTVHGMAFWFDVAFIGSSATVWLSTAPHEPLTHWYQVRCLLKSPLLVRVGQTLSGHVTLIANNRQSYDVTIDLGVDGTTQRSSNTLDLKNPYFRYSGMQAQTVPQASGISPTDAYWGGFPSGNEAAVGTHNASGPLDGNAGMNVAGGADQLRGTAYAAAAGIRGVAQDNAAAALMGVYPPNYGNTALASANTNGSVMSPRVASNLAAAASGYVLAQDPAAAAGVAMQQGQQPAQHQVHPSLATRFGLTSIAQGPVPMANNHSVVPGSSAAYGSAYQHGVPLYNAPASQANIFIAGSGHQWQHQR